MAGERNGTGTAVTLWLLVAPFAFLMTASPCSYWDMLHYDRAIEYHEHAGAMHGYAEVAIENCPEAKGACAVHATELAKQSEIWAIKERAELLSISQACRDSLNDESEAR